MLFPVAVACLGRSLSDAARPVGRLYAFNTIGAVLGSLATSFLLIPHQGSAIGAAYLVLLPLAALVVILWPRGLPAWTAAVPAVALVWVVFGTDWPGRVCALGQAWATTLDSAFTYGILAAMPAFLGFELFLVKRVPRRLAIGAAATGLVFAFTAAVPARLYQLGRQYGTRGLLGSEGEIVFFEEGVMEPVVVYRSDEGPLEISINSSRQASTVPQNMESLRLLGHLPVLLSRDPAECIVIGLGAGVTSGCVALDDRVKRVTVVELEAEVKVAAALFASTNHDVMNNPKVRVQIDDGRHFIATSGQKFGVITSDPIEPFWAGTATLYTVEHYLRCREHLADGGVFCQWLGVFGVDEETLRSLLAAFAEVFPEGSIWATASEIIFIGSREPMIFNIPELEGRLTSQPAVAASLAEIGVRSMAELFGRYVCPVRSLREYLKGATPNRDGVLRVQYVGWQAFYQSQHWNAQVRQAISNHRHIDRRDFDVPAAQADAFFGRMREEWEEFLQPTLWPGPAEGRPAATTSAPVGRE
jgi:spermidine synthase